MHRRCTILVLTICSTLAAVSGCTVDDGGGGMVVLQNNVPEPDDATGGCVIPAGLGDVFLPSGTIDVGIAANVYDLYPVVESRIETGESSTSLQKTIAVQGAEVEFIDDTADIDPFTVRFAGSVLPDGGQTTFIVRLINSVDLGSLDVDEVAIASVTVFGSLQGGDVESDPFEYPINVCDGCLKVPIGDCSSFPIEFEPRLTGSACNPGQDAKVECCTISGDDICPAIGTMTPP